MYGLCALNRENNDHSPKIETIEKRRRGDDDQREETKRHKISKAEASTNREGERRKSETVNVNGTVETHVILSPKTQAGDPPEPEELIRALTELENSASSDVVVREKIANLPPEVSEVAMLSKLEDKEQAAKLVAQDNNLRKTFSLYEQQSKQKRNIFKKCSLPLTSHFPHKQNNNNMSQRGKRQNRFDNDEPLPTKRRKGRPPTKAKIPPATAIDDDEELGPYGATSSTWQPRPIIDLKISSIYNRSAPEAPAELFRKDLISAMKLPNSEPLAADEYWVITDQWKQEWERGVQVPVNPDSLPEPTVSAKQHESFYTGRQDFKLPKNKFIRITKDDNFSSDQHYLLNTPAMAEAACAYDLDQYDDTWLKIINGERALAGAPSITEEQFERVIEELEVRCWDKIQAILKSEEGLGIEYDENVICDVCRSPDSEEANEMVFCDSCNICVNQACYGITAIPSGQWLCRTCSMGQRPDCVLCPNKGGAMKSTRSGHKWAHVSCALWIPEVSIGSVDRMEPITKISSIPTSRWALICVLCRERVGACIQCSVKTCKTAYHVTYAFQHGLEMRAIIEDENAEDGVKLRSYCQKHSLNKSKKDKCVSNYNAGGSGSDEEDTKRKEQH